MEDMKKEIAYLHKEVGKLRIMLAAVAATMAFISASFMVQYCQIRSYYQSTAESNQEILLNQKWQNSEIQRSLSMIEEILPD